VDARLELDGDDGLVAKEAPEVARPLELIHGRSANIVSLESDGHGCTRRSRRDRIDDHLG
jgi:hypothetical protein